MNVFVNNKRGLKMKNLSIAMETAKKHGFKVFPVHGLDKDNNCTCGNPHCTNRGKHPATPRGLNDSSHDESVISQLWAGRTDLNYGIATGEVSGIFVIDIDDEQGEKDLASLEALHGALPKTLTARTGRGRHLFFKHPGEKVKTRKGVIGDKVDVRGDGGYVVGPGSRHASGNHYRWDIDAPIQPAPQWLVQEVNKDNKIRTDTTPALDLGNNFYERPRPALNFAEGWTPQDVQDLLSHINPDCGYDEWIAVGMALQHEGHPFNIWDSWSQRGAKYDKHSIATHWNSFNGNGGVTFGTIVAMAEDGGWRKKRNDEKTFQTSSLMGEKRQDVTPPPLNVETKAPEKDTEPQRPKIQYVLEKDMVLNTQNKEFVQDLLGQEQLSVIYGESNCGKTFFATDLAFNVAMGTKWRGKRVEQGSVIYAALEGSHGLLNRVAAWKRHNFYLKPNMPFAMIPTPIDFLDPQGNIDEFIDVIGEIGKIAGAPKLIIIDTLARALMGGDENSGQDMGMLVYHADKIRASTGAHVCFVHHSGKDKAKGARGHSSLRAAVDTEIEISREEGAEYSTISVVKQREMEKADDMHFSLAPVLLGKNQYGEDVKSCVIEEYHPITKERMTGDALNAREQFVYDTIIYALTTTSTMRTPSGYDAKIKVIDYMELSEYLEQRGFKDLTKEDGSTTVKEATQTARLGLKKKGKINFDRNYIWLLENEKL